jgi:tetratricopeptide (TPR) repeat protein
VGDDLPRGTLVGRYVVLEPLGAGGMGIVVAAYDPELDRKVALKLLAPGGGDDAHARLLREAQAMARLSHPNVVAVYDVGVAAGRVFLAMELLEGDTLEAWCATGPRSWRQVVAVFVQAGRGLAAGHAAGVLHRDFKPSNVMIGRDGRVCVLDFGLALAVGTAAAPARRAAAPRIGDASRITHDGQVAGTPAYMAPEQHAALALDARTDQFGFCVSLFEALYRVRPFRGATADEIAEAMMDGRIVEPGLPRRVPAWLRATVLRGLSAEPADRWPSMDALLQRLAHGRAAPMRIAGWTTAAALGIGGLALANRLASEPDRVCAGADDRIVRAWHEGRRAEVIAAFAVSPAPYAEHNAIEATRALDRYADAWTRMHVEACEATHVWGSQSEALLDLRMGCLSQRLGELEAVIDLLATADEQIVARSVELTLGLPLLSRCEDKGGLGVVAPLPDDAAQRATVEELRARGHRVRALLEAGKYREALVAAQSVAAEAQAIGYAPLVAESIARLGAAQLQLGDAEAAATAFDRALWAAVAGGDDELAIRIATANAYVVGDRLARPDQGDWFLHYAEAVVHRGGDDPTLRAVVEQTRGSLALRAGRPEDAVASFQRALDDLTDTDGSPVTLAALHNNLGAALEELDRPTDAAAQFERALELYERTLGPDHPDVATALNNLGATVRARGDARAALPLHERALRIRERSLAADNPFIASTLVNLCEDRLATGEIERALASCRRALAIAESALDPSHPELARTRDALARAEQRARP